MLVLGRPKVSYEAAVKSLATSAPVAKSGAFKEGRVHGSNKHLHRLTGETTTQAP